MRTTLRALLIPVMALAVGTAALAACGGDDSKSAGSATTSSAASGTSAQAASGGTGGASATSVNLGSGGGPFCDKARAQLKGVLSGDNPAIASLISGMTDPAKAAEGKAQARAYFEQLRKDNAALVDQAPGEIKGAMRTALDATQVIFEALDKADYDFSKVDLASLGKITSDPKFTDASKKLEAYFKDTCGFDLGLSN